jgi:hypothetical protein
LSSTSDSRVRAFDLGEHGASKPAATWLQSVFGDNRLRVEWGDSSITVPHARGVDDNDDDPLCCDIAFIDGIHTYGGAMADLLNFAAVVSRPNPKCSRPQHKPTVPYGCGLLLIDDINSKDYVLENTFQLINQGTKVLNDAIDGNVVREIMRFSAAENFLRGFAVGGSTECKDFGWQVEQVDEARRIVGWMGEIKV